MRMLGSIVLFLFALFANAQQPQHHADIGDQRLIYNATSDLDWDDKITTVKTDEEEREVALLGIAKIDSGLVKDGIKLLKAARNHDPNNYDYPLEIGRAYMLISEHRRAEKYLFPLQYHSAVQPDLYVLMAQCYAEMEDEKKSPKEDRKRELDALRYGIQRLPSHGILYLELAKRNIEMEQPIEALAVLEKGIINAPNFAENYYWAAKLMSASDNHLWSWLYAEVCYSMTDDADLKRSSAIIVAESSKIVFSEKWSSAPEKFDSELNFVLKNHCNQSTSDVLKRGSEKRSCLIKHWKLDQLGIKQLLDRFRLLEERGWLESYSASIYQQRDKQKFLEWLANNGVTFETYRKWAYWNPLQLSRPIERIGK